MANLILCLIYLASFVINFFPYEQCKADCGKYIVDA